MGVVVHLTARSRLKRPLVQILVVVENIQMRNKFELIIENLSYSYDK